MAIGDNVVVEQIKNLNPDPFVKGDESDHGWVTVYENRALSFDDASVYETTGTTVVRDVLPSRYEDQIDTRYHFRTSGSTLGGSSRDQVKISRVGCGPGQEDKPKVLNIGPGHKVPIRVHFITNTPFALSYLVSVDLDVYDEGVLLGTIHGETYKIEDLPKLEEKAYISAVFKLQSEYDVFGEYPNATNVSITINAKGPDPTHTVSLYFTGVSIGLPEWLDHFDHTSQTQHEDLHYTGEPGESSSRLVGRSAVDWLTFENGLVGVISNFSITGVGKSLRLINNSYNTESQPITVYVFSGIGYYSTFIYQTDKEIPSRVIKIGEGPDALEYDAGYFNVVRSSEIEKLKKAEQGIHQIELMGSAFMLMPVPSFGESIYITGLTTLDRPHQIDPFDGDSTDVRVIEGQITDAYWEGVPYLSNSVVDLLVIEPWDRVVDWDSPASRMFELGVDRGMVYVPGGYGVPWNGLLSVNINPGQGQIENHYVDGVKFDMDVPPSDFSATVEAYTYPDVLEECVGSPTYEGVESLTIHNQLAKPFSFCYRTLIGDAASGTDRGYKLHLVYNAYAKPSTRSYATLEAAPSASTFSWEVQTIPQKLDGYRPTSHITIDSTKTNPIVLEAIEQVLYGADGVPPELPSMEELISYLEANS